MIRTHNLLIRGQMMAILLCCVCQESCSNAQASLLTPMEMPSPLALETTDLYTPTVPAKKTKVAKQIKFRLARRKEEVQPGGKVVARLGDVNDPESIQRFRDAAAKFTRRRAMSKGTALNTLVGEGIYTQSGKLAKAYR